MGELVSIIMPAYNAEKYIGQAIESVLSQTYREWELIVVDDGSKDRTAEIVKHWASADSRIAYVSQPNGGQGKARNEGMVRARGELLAFLDSDDLWLPAKLEAQIRTLTEEAVDLVFSDGYLFVGDDWSDETETLGTLVGRFEGREFLPMLFASNRIPILSVLVRRSALHETRPFREDRRFQNSEDYDLWLKLARRGAVFYGMPERLVRYRRHTEAATAAPGSTSNLRTLADANIKTLEATIAVLQEHRNAPGLPERLVRKRLVALYRTLIAALLDANRVKEARGYVRELRRVEPFSIKTLGRTLVVELIPGQYGRLRSGWRWLLYKLRALPKQ